MISCPNCQHPVKPSDDLCENCGAVLDPTFAPLPTVPVSISSPVAGLISCPNCHQMTSTADGLCEQCGMVLNPSGSISSRTTTPALASTNSTTSPALSTQTTCPRCGRFRSSSKRFCNSCGYHFGDETTDSQASQLAPGTILHNKYRIVRAIGSGGMGAVYLAEDPVLKRQVVIKALLTDNDPEMAAQSVREREFLATIKHSNIVSIYDFVTIGTCGYIVMEYVQGETLDQLMEQQGRPFDAPEAIRLILEILPAFSYLAKLDLVYCDFKPQNVMSETLKDGSRIVKLIDLGTVIRYEPKPKDVYGTHGFYAPEAAHHPSTTTDLYSVCRTLAFLITEMDLTNPRFGMPPSEYYRAFRDYPTLYRLLCRGTHSNPALRFQAAEDLADQLRGVLRQIEGGKPGLSVPSRQFVSGMLTTTGRLGPRGEATLDTRDKAISLLSAGDLALRSGNYTSASNLYRQATQNHPDSLDAHLRLAEVLIDQNDYSTALAEITQVQRKSPGHWKVSWYTGRLLEAQGRLDDAAQQYLTLMADLPGELPPMQALARVNAKQDRHLEAINLYTAVLKADPGNTETIFGLTHSLMTEQRWAEAAQVLGTISEATARYVEAQLLLCDLYLNHITPRSFPQIQQAAQTLKSLEGRTQHSRYYLMAGNVYYAAWKMARENTLPKGATLPDLPQTTAREIGLVTEKHYRLYLRQEQHPADREAVLRRAFEVAPWRLF